MCVGSHLAVYRKYNISLHINLASLIPVICICCFSIVIWWIGRVRYGVQPVFSVIYSFGRFGLEDALKKANDHVYVAVISIG